MTQRWSILSVLVGCFLIILARPYDFQKLAPIWFSVPIVFFTTLLCIVQVVLYSHLFFRLRHVPPPSWILTLLAALVAVQLVDDVMYWVFSRPFMGVKEYLLKSAFTFLYLEFWFYLYGAFAVPRILIELQPAPRAEGRLGAEAGVKAEEGAARQRDIRVGNRVVSEQDLIRVEAQNVYVSVITTKGELLIRVRFADMLEDLSGWAGIQTHRSHWVSADWALDYEESEGQRYLRLRDGQRVPVARSRSAEVKNWLRQHMKEEA